MDIRETKVIHFLTLIMAPHSIQHFKETTDKR